MMVLLHLIVVGSVHCTLQHDLVLEVALHVVALIIVSGATLIFLITALDILTDLRDTLDFALVVATKESGPCILFVNIWHLWRESCCSLERGWE